MFRYERGFLRDQTFERILVGKSATIIRNIHPTFLRLAPSS